MLRVMAVEKETFLYVASCGLKRTSKLSEVSVMTRAGGTAKDPLYCQEILTTQALGNAS